MGREIYRRPDSRFWWIRYYVKGKLHRESSKSTRHEDAKDLLDKRKGERQAGTLVTTKARLQDVMELWIRDCELRELRGVQTYRRGAELALEVLGNPWARDVKTATLMEYQQELKRRAYKPATINNHVGFVRTALRVAARAGLLHVAPQPPLRVKERKRRTGFIDQTAYEEIRAELPEWARDVFEFAYVTGWRRAEVIWLEWGEVDFEAQQVRLSPHRSKNEQGRVWPMRLMLRPLIDRRLEQRIPGLPEVFHYRDRRIEWCTFWYYWRRARARVKRPDQMFHDCRRTAVTNLERAGVRRALAMELVGHQTEQMYRRYNIVNPNEFAEAEMRYKRYMDRIADEKGGRVLPFVRS